MIIRLMYEKDSPNGMNISYKFIEEKNQTVLATATDNFNEYIALFFNNNTYFFPNVPKIINKCEVNLKYPLTSNRRKTVGFPMKLNDTDYGYYYQEAAKCKKGLFGKNIGFTVFSTGIKVFMLFRVGFKGENSHYYCLYEENTLVAIIERHNYSEDNCKATIYVEDKNYLEIAFIACTEELISVPNSGGNEFSMDTSAGHYISVLDEEKELFDANFILRVKEKS